MEYAVTKLVIILLCWFIFISFTTNSKTENKYKDGFRRDTFYSYLAVITFTEWTVNDNFFLHLPPLYKNPIFLLENIGHAIISLIIAFVLVSIFTKSKSKFK
mgnify:FL=1